MMSPDKARKQIADLMKQNGMSDKGAAAASEDALKEGDKKVREGMIERAYGDHDKIPLGKVEQFNASEVAAKFQNSVGGGPEDESKKQTG